MRSARPEPYARRRLPGATLVVTGGWSTAFDEVAEVLVGGAAGGRGPGTGRSSPDASRVGRVPGDVRLLVRGHTPCWSSCCASTSIRHPSRTPNSQSTASEMRVAMSVYRVIDVIGTSPTSWGAAQRRYPPLARPCGIRVAEVIKQTLVGAGDPLPDQGPARPRRIGVAGRRSDQPDGSRRHNRVAERPPRPGGACRAASSTGSIGVVTRRPYVSGMAGELRAARTPGRAPRAPPTRRRRRARAFDVVDGVDQLQAAEARGQDARSGAGSRRRPGIPPTASVGRFGPTASHRDPEHEGVAPAHPDPVDIAQAVSTSPGPGTRAGRARAAAAPVPSGRRAPAARRRAGSPPVRRRSSWRPPRPGRPPRPAGPGARGGRRDGRTRGRGARRKWCRTRRGPRATIRP